MIPLEIPPDVPSAANVVDNSVTVSPAQGGHDRVLAAIRHAILRGHMAPGQRLTEADLAQQFTTSRGAVRSALIVLGSEGLIEHVRNRGARVRIVTLHESVEVTEVRMYLEGLCAAKAAEQVDNGEACELREIGVGMSESVESGDLLSYSDLNMRLHSKVREIARHGVANQIIERLRGQSGVTHQFHLGLQPGRAAISLDEHLAIIERIVQRDADGAESAMQAHLKSVLIALRKTEETDGPPKFFVPWADVI